MKTSLKVNFIRVVLLIFVQSIYSQWATNSAINNTICAAPNVQFQQVSVSDGNGGAIIAWSDKRNDTGSGTNLFDIYAQCIDANGNLKWTTNGVPICTSIGGQRFPAIVSDNNGGAIISWTDERNSFTNISDIYAQRVSSIGTMLWALNGVSICSKINAQENSAIASDGNGGAIITWEDNRNGLDYNIFAQSINALGVTQWNLDGIVVCNATNNQKKPQVIAAETGQAIFVWEDSRTAVAVYDIYAVKINSGGGNAWGGTANNGVPICTATNNQLEPNLVADGNFGAIITWYDRRNANDYNIYAQKIIANGTVPWLTVGGQGLEICTATGNQVMPQICSNMTNGAIITWSDTRQSPTESDIYVQKINSDGNTMWGTNGSGVISTAGNQFSPSIISNGSGGALISWTDYRNGANADIYCQQFNSFGAAQWNGNIVIGGVAVCTEASDQLFPPTIVNGNVGEAIVIWRDGRNVGFDYDIYAQKINGSGSLSKNTVQSINQNFTIYPNPSTNSLFSIQSKNPVKNLSAFDIIGKQIDIEKNNDFYKIHASSGIYTIKITNSDGNSHSNKLIIQ